MRPRAFIAAAALGAALFCTSQVAQAAPMGAPQFQTGAVHSCPPPQGTNGQAAVTTSDGGLTWDYNGGPGSPSMQYGVVHSFTTGGNANVLTFNGGQTWEFHNNGGPLYCSPPR